LTRYINGSYIFLLHFLIHIYIFFNFSRHEIYYLKCRKDNLSMMLNRSRVVHESADYYAMAVDSMTVLSLVSKVARGPSLYWKSKKEKKKKENS
jgi:hypothetical protein